MGRWIIEPNTGSSEAIGKWNATLNDLIRKELHLIGVLWDGHRLINLEAEKLKFENRTLSLEVLEYQVDDMNLDMLPLLKDLHTQGLRILVFSGDQDSVVPLIGTRTMVRQLAGDLRLRTSIPYRAWYQNQQVGGWTIAYGKNLTYATVRGAAHMVPYSQPSRALTLFKCFLSGKSLPSH